MKKFKLITIIGNLTVIFVFSWVFISNPLESVSGNLLILVILSMANLYFLIDKNDYKQNWLKFWQRRK